MSITPSANENRALLKWLNQNRQHLLDSYPDQYIAYNTTSLIASGDRLQDVLEKADASQQPFIIYLVPKSTASIQILPIRFRSVIRHE